MPNIEVAELLDDPDFTTSVVFIRRALTVGIDGRAAITETQSPPTPAIVQPGIYRRRNEQPAQAVEGTVSVWTRYVLRMTRSGQLPDLMVWRGQRYQLSTLEDWSAWTPGLGFFKAEFVLEEVEGPTDG